ncbi:MAG: SDR family NAD(P)-dependent oxidoreductase, partial [Sphingobacteriaceae bacterium]|nr:SDR family NAD(P)-dependent oxidoreductase [Cytophagaceae bacterium]
MKTALITGASSGIGTEFARVFAKNGYTLVVAARSADKLKTLARELETAYRVSVHVLPLDLSKADAP